MSLQTFDWCYNDDMNSVGIYREALKERERLPIPVGVEFAEVEETIVFFDVYAGGLTHKREAGWRGRTMLVAEARYHRTSYRMAWEVISRIEAYIWAYGPHEGFYARLGRRAHQ